MPRTRPAVLSAILLLTSSAGCMGGSSPAGDGPDAGATNGDPDPGVDPTGARDGSTPQRGDSGATATPDAGPPWDGGNNGPSATCTAPGGDFSGLQMIECVPSGMTGKTGTPAPLVVALHGFTQQATDYEDTTQWAMLAGRRGFYVIFPAAPGGRSWTWFSGNRARDQGDSTGIMAMVAQMKASHDIRTDMIFVTGLSAGGFMTTVLLADYPDVFAAGAAVAGGAYGCDMGCMSAGTGGNNAQAVKAAYPSWWNDPSTRKPRLMIVQGDKDNIVSYTNMAQTMQQWTSALGAPATPANAQLGLETTLKGYPYSVYSRDGHSVDVATVTITGMGHGTPIDPGTGPDQGGHDGSYTFAVKFYSPYYVAKFFGLL